MGVRRPWEGRDPPYGRVFTVGHRGLATMWRCDAQFGNLLVAYQWGHWLQPLYLRPGLEGRKRDMRRITKPVEGSIPIAEAEGGDWLESWPHLTEFLTATRFSDPVGPRKPGTLFVTTRFKLWSATLKCPNDGVQLRCEGKTPEQLWHALETFLSGPDAPWEPDPYFKAPAGKGKR